MFLVGRLRNTWRQVYESIASIGYGAMAFIPGGGEVGVAEKTIAKQLSRETSAKLSTEGVKLAEHLRQVEKYGKAGFKELANGRFRYYDNVTLAEKSGEMVGRRVVREWDHVNGFKRTWHETIDLH